VSIERGAQESESGVTENQLRWKTFLMILVMVVTAPLGNVLLGKGMKHIGVVPVRPASAFFHGAVTVFTSPTIWSGIALLIAFFLSYMLVLSWADYSFVQPASSLSYGVVALLGYAILGEKVSPLRWLGIAIICLGVFLVTRTGLQTTRRDAKEQS
jgi:drug/metabolite transporter (DMT)-like permease